MWSFYSQCSGNKTGHSRGQGNAHEGWTLSDMVSEAAVSAWRDLAQSMWTEEPHGCSLGLTAAWVGLLIQHKEEWMEGEEVKETLIVGTSRILKRFSVSFSPPIQKSESCVCWFIFSHSFSFFVYCSQNSSRWQEEEEEGNEEKKPNQTNKEQRQEEGEKKWAGWKKAGRLHDKWKGLTARWWAKKLWKTEW